MALPLMLIGCEDILGKWERPTPAVPSVTKTAGTISYASTTMLRGSLDPAFSNALTQVGNGSITYQSSDPSVATVDATTGKVTPVAVGTVTIKAIVSDSETYTYASKEASYTIELQDGYSYRFWNTTSNQFETAIKPSSECELITSSTTTFSGKRYIAIGNLTIDHDIDITGVSGITLCDNAELTINGRLHGNKDLLIFAQSEGDEVGKLNVTTNTGTDGDGVIDLSTDLTDLAIHGGKIVVTATGNTTQLYGIKCANLNIYGGDIKAQGNESSASIGSHGIYRGYYSGVIGIHGGRVVAIGGNSTGGTNRAGDGICGKYVIDGTAIVIATGGNAIGVNKSGGYGIDANSFGGSIGGSAQVTAQGGNGVGGGCAMHLQGDVTIQENAVVTATGGDNIGTDSKGGSGSNNGTLTLKDQASFTARGGKSSGNADGQDAMWNFLDYYGGTFTAIGGAKGPSGANDGKAVRSSYYIQNQTSDIITLEYSDDGQTWGGTFDINASTSSTPTYHAVRKMNQRFNRDQEMK